MRSGRGVAAAYSGAKAEAPSTEAGPSQNRRRDRRTYQLDRSSMKAASRRPAAAVSNASNNPVTSRTTACSSLSTHRSSSGRSARPGAEESAVQPPAFAYSTRNEAVFQYVSSTLRTISLSASWPTRRSLHGDPEAAKNQRSASAPCASMSGIGSSTLPRRLLLLTPPSSTIRPTHTPLSHADRPDTSVPPARRD